MQKIQGSINYTQENNNRKGSDIKFNWQRLQATSQISNNYKGVHKIKGNHASRSKRIYDDNALSNKKITSKIKWKFWS